MSLTGCSQQTTPRTPAKSEIQAITQKPTTTRDTRRERTANSERRKAGSEAIPTRLANVAGRSVDTDYRVVSRKQDLPDQGDPQAIPLESPKARRGATLTVLHLI